MKRPLDGIKVIEYGNFIAAPYCARLLADFGADVIKIEEPGLGDEARKRGPFPNDIPDPEKSGFFSYLNWNKKGITLNLQEPDGRAVMRRLLKDADVLIEDTYPGQDAKLGLDYKTLAKFNPDLIVTSITPFGKTGSYKNFKAYPLNLAHGSGAAYVLPCGDVFLANPDREPIKTGGYLCEYNSAEDAVLATAAALFWRGAGGTGQHVDISRREAIASLSRYEFARYNQGFIENRNSRSFPVGGLMVCKDGFVEVMLMEKKNWEGLINLIGSPEWASREEYQFEKVVKGFGKVEEMNPRIKQEVNDYITCWMLEHTKEEIYHRGQELGACITMVATTQDVFESKQLNARNYFVEVDHPRMGVYKFPSWPYKFSGTTLSVDRPAPLLGQHNEEVLTHLGYSKQDMIQLKAAGVI